LDGLPAALARLGDEVTRRRVRHVVTENSRVLETAAVLRSGGDPRRIGPLLTASHRSLRDDYEVSAARVDLAVETALLAGAYGARITGGGFGGSVVALIDRGRAEAIFRATEAAYLGQGFVAPGYRLVRPSAGAGRIALADGVA
jgi:galactokinase